MIASPGDVFEEREVIRKLFTIGIILTQQKPRLC